MPLLYYKISDAIDNHNVPVGAFIDLSKAFDTIDHTILLDTLFHYGISGVAHNWFANYARLDTRAFAFSDL